MAPNLDFKVPILFNVNLKIVQDKAIVTTEGKVLYDLSIGAIFNDLERPLTQISRSRQYSTLNVPVTAEGRETYLQ